MADAVMMNKNNGVPKYELLIDYTTTELTKEINITKDLQGNDLSFDSCAIYINIVGYSENNNDSMYFGVNNGYISDKASVLRTGNTSVRIYIPQGLSSGIQSYISGSADATNFIDPENPGSPGKPGTRIRLYTSSSTSRFGIGTHVKVYGVRV